MNDDTTREGPAYEAWFRSQQGVAYAGSWEFARAAWMHRATHSAASLQEGWRGKFCDLVYADLAAADNQDVPLEEYPERILKVLDTVLGAACTPPAESAVPDDADLKDVAEQIMRGMRSIALWGARRDFAVRVLRDWLAAAPKPGVK